MGGRINVKLDMYYVYTSHDKYYRVLIYEFAAFNLFVTTNSK